jgi:hypothetical protein
MRRITQLFTSHPSSVDETYFQHFLFAGRFGVILVLAALAAFAHAILPFLFEKTASQMVAKLYERTHNRGTTLQVTELERVEA